jgi:hypothetical protein
LLLLVKAPPAIPPLKVTRTACRPFEIGRHDHRFCTTGNSRICAMRKLPVAPICRDIAILFFRNQLDAGPKSGA